MDDHDGSGASDLSLQELMEEYSSRPPQIAEWLWCIEYVAKFVKDIRCILDLMNMGYQYSNDHGSRINEVLSLRVLEFMFDPSKNVSTRVGSASTSEARVEFDLSLSNADVLRAILKEIPVSGLRAGMPELSKFNVLPFIAHKNMCLSQCALEKLRDVNLMEKQTGAAPSMEENASDFRDDRLVQMNTCKEEPIDEEQVHIGLEQSINEKDKVIVICDEDEPTNTNEKDEVVVIDEGTENDQDTTAEPISSGSATGETFPATGETFPATGETFPATGETFTENDQDTTAEPISSGSAIGETFPATGETFPATGESIPPSSRRWPEDERAKCTKDRIWLVSESELDDELDMVKGPALIKKNTNTCTNLLPLSSRTRTENDCWKYGKEGPLLICRRSECTSIVHKERLNCAINVDEDRNFHCPVGWYDDGFVAEYLDSQKLLSSAKKRLLKFMPLLSTRNKRLKVMEFSAATSL